MTIGRPLLIACSTIGDSFCPLAKPALALWHRHGKHRYVVARRLPRSRAPFLAAGVSTPSSTGAPTEPKIAAITPIARER